MASIGVASTSFAQTEEIDVFHLAPFVTSGENYAFGAQKTVHVTDKDLERPRAEEPKESHDNRTFC
ncbi:hypothetical protein [Pelagicoccus sp. SDUM812002]|uniref:hypothetical protein n=1 Tax=Pelagicoccus sp. SDUM812002 TaxID=3041266 RepID=UPI00280E4E6D|nr:hypothetical protein [Pelagicoccus sp. SDUM812002]MDQ8183947.1 hypothetical protein [Pelagicoccus sp. SDUM812002]